MNRFLFISCLFFLTCSADPDKFEYLRSPKKAVISEFNRPNLLFGMAEDKEFFAKIEDGVYHFRFSDTKNKHIKSLFTIAYDGDFEIEASVSGNKDKPESYIGIALTDLNEGEDFIESSVNWKDSFAVANQEKWIMYSNGNQNITSKFQILTIRKVGSDLFFFKNGVFKYQHKIGTIKSFKVAISTGNSGRGAIDYFKIIRY
ncbi:hypothetical protein [Leptospira neocaledonica]|uniref:Uncharacterized protein n=1 Tax=Leptospira neocaledonica TaxID=2023192 RepID=A0A2M9ZZ93_9LEPT|nr:hypothetical protein [Leptospira neocaledonica]PJZ77367.1 hypothetical protein CH365_07175 [Leptospira neocaledonica]